MTSETGDGFTLLELLVVLSIMVLVACAWPFAAPHVFPTQQLRNQAQQVIAMLRSVRASARISGAIQNLELKEDGRVYYSSNEAHVLPRGMVLRFEENDGDSYPGEIYFYPDGSATGGALELALSGRSVRIGVGSATGRAEILH